MIVNICQWVWISRQKIIWLARKGERKLITIRFCTVYSKIQNGFGLAEYHSIFTHRISIKMKSNLFIFFLRFSCLTGQKGFHAIHHLIHLHIHFFPPHLIYLYTLGCNTMSIVFFFFIFCVESFFTSFEQYRMNWKRIFEWNK